MPENSRGQGKVVSRQRLNRPPPPFVAISRLAKVWDSYHVVLVIPFNNDGSSGSAQEGWMGAKEPYSDKLPGHGTARHPQTL